MCLLLISLLRESTLLNWRTPSACSAFSKLMCHLFNRRTAIAVAVSTTVRVANLIFEHSCAAAFPQSISCKSAAQLSFRKGSGRERAGGLAHSVCPLVLARRHFSIWANLVTAGTIPRARTKAGCRDSTIHIPHVASVAGDHHLETALLLVNRCIFQLLSSWHLHLPERVVLSLFTAWFVESSFCTEALPYISYFDTAA